MYPGCFCEVVENRGFVLARVQKSAKEGGGVTENKGVSASIFAENAGKCEVAENAGVRGFER